MGLYIPTCFWVFPVTFGRHDSITRSKIMPLSLPPSYPTLRTWAAWSAFISWGRTQYIFPFFADCDRQNLARMRPLKGYCICSTIMNAKDRHLIRAPETKHTHITMEVSTKFTFLCVVIPPCALYLDTPTSSRRRFPCCCDLIYFDFLIHCIWGVRRLTHLWKLLVEDIVMNTYGTWLIATSCMLHRKWVATNITCQGGIMESKYKGTTTRCPWTHIWIGQSHPGTW